MDRRAKFAGFVVASLVAGAAQAQFNMDITPSAMRAAQAKAMNPNPDGNGERLQDRAKRRGVQPLGSIGESQSASQSIQPLNVANAPQTYAGTPTDPTGTPVDINGKPLPADPSVDDPNKPRQPLKPKSLNKGVAPR